MIAHDEIRAAVGAYETAKKARWDAWQRITEIAGTRDAAIESDATLLADAIEAGEEDPGQPNTLRVDAEIAAARRKAEATDVLIDRRVADVQASLDEYADEWISQLEGEHAEAVRAWLARVDVIAEAQAKMVAAEALMAFTSSGKWWPHGTDHRIEGAIGTLRSAYTPAVVEEPSAA